MRPRRSSSVHPTERWVRIAAIALASVLMMLPASAAGRVIAQEQHVCSLFALRGVVFYLRAPGGPEDPEAYCGSADPRYGRVVNGQRLAVAGLPDGAAVNANYGSSVGLDRHGRVVV